MTVNVRFAPSPTGLLHVGNVRAALLNWLFARQQNGHFLLRFDDTDAERSQQIYIDAIREDLRWLGLNWDHEARQSERLSQYQAAADKLREMGRLYPCYETPEELGLKRRLQLGRGLPPVYDRAALLLGDADRARFEAEGKKPHWRFKLDTTKRVEWHDLIRGPQSIDPASLSDPVLIRADGSFLYMLPSTVDDIDFAISHVVRGEDHVTNSGEQIQIFEALGKKPPLFAHYPLLKAKGGGKFSKRAGSGSIRALRDEMGLEADAINSFIARLGSADSIEPFIGLEPLIAAFDFSRFSRSSAIFDEDELDQINARILHQLPFDRVAMRPELDGLGEDFWQAVRNNLVHWKDIRQWVRVVRGPLSPLIDAEDRSFLAEAAELLPPALDDESWKSWTTALKNSTGRKGKALFLPLRLALTAKDHGPEMAALLPMIGAVSAQKRLRGEGA
ncbi:glutamate--tRNA ligase 1 [Iodidimonas nitroreducens]|uniref:Glutamate--tRNA ligase n=1 Tax=Iodidimonas nitroreducens TaxID=1236968 RepID=A0A5A7NBL1_9PROT|nr:glutamate--tRNA ligase [Iodidimonas nitroreducens]GAK32269.1 glutamate--tRNA ligase 1 [alpha proteobacterium Q-1]GER04880.1 glutamate--tRNA ligase 1 [Iodidimonas nitroreducens]